MKYKYQHLGNFDPNTWITYSSIYVMGCFLTNKIKYIPKEHLVSSFDIVSAKTADWLEKRFPYGIPTFNVVAV